MRLVFLGTSEFAVPTLEALCIAGHEVVLVLCQPDRPAGRGRRFRSGPVKQRALSRGLDLLQPEQLSQAVVGRVSALGVEAAVVVSYGLILPRELLDVPPLGCVNLHASLLPKYRGAAPVAHAILRGETVTGVTTLQMDEGIDTGAILLQRSTPLGAEESAGEVEARLAGLGSGLMVETLERLARGDLEPQPQAIDRESYAPKIAAASGRIPWEQEASAIARRVRAFNPRPGAFTMHRGKVLKIWRAGWLPAPAGRESPPGTVLERETGFQVACGGGSCLVPQEVQLEGRRRVSSEEALRGRWVAPGDHFGEEESTGRGEGTA